jgi:hypothetical protein
MTRFHRLLAAPLLCLLACQGGELPAPGPGSPRLSGTPVTLTRFGTDSYAFAFNSGITSPLNAVVRDPAAWSALWQNIHAPMTPVPPLPAVDFSQEMVVAAGLGNRSTGGYDVLLAHAAEDATGLQIEVIETSPGPGCATSQALTQPVDLARTARRDGPVRFVTTQRVNHCDS